MYIHDTLVNRSLWNNRWPRIICRSLWPIFHAPVIFLNISNTIRHIYIILGQWINVILKMTSYYRQVGVTCISCSSDFSLKLQHYLMYIPHALVNRSSWNNKQPQTICRWLWPIFHGPVILINISNTIRHNYIILGLTGYCDTTNDLIL